MNEKLKDLLNQVNKKHGEGSLISGGDVVKNVPIMASTGSIKLDFALGCGGNPRGRMIEYFGPPSGGKTCLSLISAIEIQKVGGVVAFIDVENSFDRSWFELLGGNSETLIFNQPSSGDEALDIVDLMVKSNEIDFIILDSTTALATRAELEGEMGDAHIGQLARLMSTGLKKINSALGSSKATVAFISQTRTKIGSYGNPEESASGGAALKFYASIRYEVRRGDVIGEKDHPIGFITKLNIKKNKVGPPFRKVETSLYIGPDRYGIDKVSEICDLAIENNIVTKAGAWIKFDFNGNEERFQGRESFTEFVKNTPEFYQEIYNKISKTVLKNDMPVIGSFNDLSTKTPVAVVEPKKRTKKQKEAEMQFEEISPSVVAITEDLV